MFSVFRYKLLPRWLITANWIKHSAQNGHSGKKCRLRTFSLCKSWLPESCLCLLPWTQQGVVRFYQETLWELLDLTSKHSVSIWHQEGWLTLSGRMVEHLGCCVVVNDLPGALTCFRLLFYTTFFKIHFFPECQFCALCFFFHKYWAIIFVEIQAYWLGPSRAQIIT